MESAINVNQVAVKFNQAVATEDATLTLKRGSAVYASTTEWNEDKNTATLTSAVSKLPKGDYTVEIAGLTEEVIVKQITIEEEVVDAIEVTSNNVFFANNAKISFSVLNQYGTDMAVRGNVSGLTVSAYNVTQRANVTLQKSTTKSEFLLPANYTGNDDFEVGDEIRVTVSYQGITTQKVLKVIEVANISSITLGDVQPLEDKSRINVTDEGLELPYELFDQYGEEVTFDEGNLADIEEQGVTFTSSNSSIVNVNSFSVDEDGVITFDAGATAGTAVITAIINATGEVSTTRVTVEAASKLDSLAITPPSELIAAGEEVKLAYVAEDQFGSKLSFEDDEDLFDAITWTSSNTDVVAHNGVEFNEDGELVVTTLEEGSVTLTAKVDNKTVGTVSFAVEEEAVLTSISKVSDLPTKVVPGATFDIEEDNLVIKDQYGRDYDLSAEESVSVEFKATSTGALQLSADEITSEDGITVTGGATQATETLVFTLVDADGINVDGGTFEYKVTNIKLADVETYSVKNIETLKSGFEDVASAGSYAKDIVIRGYDKSGEEVAITTSHITSITSSNTAVVGVNRASLKVFGKAEGTSTIAVWIGSKKVAETTVTVSEDAGTATSAKFEENSYVLNGNGTLNLASELTVKDQYGVTLGNPESLGTWSSSDTTKATVVNGVVYGHSTGKVDITFVLENGKDVKTVQVDVRASYNAPEVTANVEDGELYSDEIELTVDVANGNLVELLLNDAEVAVGTTATEGENTLVITFEDVVGNEFTETITFTIDTTAPVVTGVEDGVTYDAAVTPASADGDIETVTLTLDDEVVEDYTLGTQLEANGDYVLTVVDFAGNETVIEFTIEIAG